MLWLNWFITDKSSYTLKMSKQIKSSRAALFCKTSQFSTEIVCDEAQKGHYHCCFLVNRFCECNLFSLFHSFHVRTCSSYNVGLLKNFGKLKENFCARVFFSWQSCTWSSLQRYLKGTNVLLWILRNCLKHFVELLRWVLLISIQPF